MNRVRRTCLGCLLITLYFLGCRQIAPFQINYFGQSPAKLTPLKFAPGVISLEGRWEGNAGFSSDGKSFYFNIFTDSSKTIYHSNFEQGNWSTPAPMKKLSEFNSWEPFPSWDGQSLYFVADRLPGNPEWNGRIWRMKSLGGNKWSKPEHIDLNISTTNGLWFPNVSKNGNLFFGGRLKTVDSVGMSDLYYTDLYKKEVRLIPDICSSSDDWDPFAAPDESYILWASDRPGGYGGMDLYVSFRSNTGKGRWEKPINLGSAINTPDYEVAPRISPDGKFLFFDRPKDGTQDIYWVSTQVIQELRP